MKSMPIARIMLIFLFLITAILSIYWLGPGAQVPLAQDYQIYEAAHSDTSQAGNPYLPYDVGRSFIYLPSALSFIDLFTRFGSNGYWLWLLMSLLAWAGSILLLIHMMTNDLSAFAYLPLGGSSPSRLIYWLFLLYAPFWETLYLGQINAFVTLSLILSFFYAEYRNNNLLAGLTLAAAIILKFSPFILLLYYLARIRFRVLAYTAVFVLLFSFITSLQFTPQLFFDYSAVLPLLGQEIHPTVFNQSLPSVIFRLSSQSGWPISGNILLIVHRLFLGLGLLPVLMLLYKSRQNNHQDKQIATSSYAALVVAMFIYSPLLWYHHALFLIFPIIWLLLHSSPRYVMIGFVILFLVQMERVLEFIIGPLPLFIIFGQLAIWVITIHYCLNIFLELRTGSPST